MSTLVMGFGFFIASILMDYVPNSQEHFVGNVLVKLAVLLVTITTVKIADEIRKGEI